ncbi:hypothetical protein ACF0H5_002178 [Mactra antiquata]
MREHNSSDTPDAQDGNDSNNVIGIENQNYANEMSENSLENVEESKNVENCEKETVRENGIKHEHDSELTNNKSMENETVAVETEVRKISNEGGFENGGFNGIADTDNENMNRNGHTKTNGTEMIDMKGIDCRVRISDNFIDSSPSKHSMSSVDMEDGPTYLPKAQVRSRRRMEIGSENLITNNDLLLAATLVANAMEGQKFNVKREPRFIRYLSKNDSICRIGVFGALEYLRMLDYEVLMDISDLELIII